MGQAAHGTESYPRQENQEVLRLRRKVARLRIEIADEIGR
jgi:hypothetical protein